MTSQRPSIRLALAVVLAAVATAPASGFRPEIRIDRDGPGGRTREEWAKVAAALEAEREERALEEMRRQQAADAYRQPRSKGVRYEPIFADTPHLVFKLPSGLRGSDVPRDVREAIEQRRYELGHAFDVANVTILAAELTDIPERQRLYARKLRWNMPPERLRVEPRLTRLLGGARRPLAADIRAALRPYRGKTMIVIGHVEGRPPAMRWSVGAGGIDLDLALWTQIALEEGVNLLMLGCKSAGAADIGSVHMVNSNALIDKLIGAMATAPGTFKGFYAALSGPDHIIAFNAFNPAMTYVTQARIERDDGTHTWNIAWLPPGTRANPPPPPPPAGTPIATTAQLGSLLLAGCDATSRTGEELDACEERETATVSAIDDARSRARGLREQAADIRRATMDRDAAAGRFWHSFAAAIAIVGAAAAAAAGVNDWKVQRVDTIDAGPFRPSWRKLGATSGWAGALVGAYGLLLWSGWPLTGVLAGLLLVLPGLLLIGATEVARRQRTPVAIATAASVACSLVTLVWLFAAATTLWSAEEALTAALQPRPTF